MALIKGILLPIRAEYLVRILNGEKTQELRKSLPKGFVGWVYLYCTKAKPNLALVWENYDDNFGYPTSLEYYSIENDIVKSCGCGSDDILNGKVVARFWFDEYSDLMETWTGNEYEFIGLDKICLDEFEILEYLVNKPGYLWHIKQLEIFDKPKELKDFYVLRHELVDNDFLNPPYWRDVKHTLTRAPQSWQYVYTKEKE